jgi:N-acetylmuramic acid 6-phosphate etherase
LQAVENAEDDAELGAQDLKNIQFCANDVLVGIAASGRTLRAGRHGPRQSGGRHGLQHQLQPGSPLAQAADISMVAVVGPEIVTGSSRMKAGTAQKLILNMLSTGAMIRTGKVYGNLMVDVEATNAKLVERQKRIVMEATDCERAVAERALAQADNHCKTAIVMILAGLTADEARTACKAATASSASAPTDRPTAHWPGQGWQYHNENGVPGTLLTPQTDWVLYGKNN